MADKFLERLSPLGKASQVPLHYDPSVLFAVPRSLARKNLGIGATLPFEGFDLWSCYELSWEDKSGIPQVAICRIEVPCDSPSLVESKSLKLYLNGFSTAKYSSATEVAAAIQDDLERLLHGKIKLQLFTPQSWETLRAGQPSGSCLDQLTPRKIALSRDIKLLRTEAQHATESLYSNLFRSYCPVTGQPDWATVLISYSGRKIEILGLFEYLLSLRNHQGFHEECAEMIFVDLLEVCRPEKLLVQLNFTRRGGIQINPLRHTPNFECADRMPQRLARQ